MKASFPQCFRSTLDSRHYWQSNRDREGVLYCRCSHGLRRCCSGSKNLDQLVLLVKNWPDDPCTGCDAQCLDDFCEEEADLIDQPEKELEGETEELLEQCSEESDIDI